MSQDRQSEQIPINLNSAISLAQAAKLMRGRGGRRPAIETVRRWANPKKGCYPAGKSGPQLILQTIKVNHEILTLPEWVTAFEQARARAGERPVVEVPRTKGERKKAHQEAGKRLDDAGIKGK